MGVCLRGEEQHLRSQEDVIKSDYRITPPFRRLFANVWGGESLGIESVGRIGLAAERWPLVRPWGHHKRKPKPWSCGSIFGKGLRLEALNQVLTVGRRRAW